MSIEQADKIVGITVSVNRFQSQEYKETANAFRRGAYIEWIATQDESICIDELLKRGSRNYRVGMMPLDKIAEAIVAIHAATQPKGDGLPDLKSISIDIEARGTGWFSVNIMASGAKSESATMYDYLTRCLSKPVRRLLAEFEVTDERPKDQGVFALGRRDGEPVISSAPPHAPFPLTEREIICFIVPKSRKD